MRRERNRRQPGSATGRPTEHGVQRGVLRVRLRVEWAAWLTSSQELGEMKLCNAGSAAQGVL
jgi:hypothetical protein